MFSPKHLTLCAIAALSADSFAAQNATQQTDLPEHVRTVALTPTQDNTPYDPNLPETRFVPKAIYRLEDHTLLVPTRIDVEPLKQSYPAPTAYGGAQHQPHQRFVPRPARQVRGR